MRVTGLTRASLPVPRKKLDVNPFCSEIIYWVLSNADTKAQLAVLLG